MKESEEKNGAIDQIAKTLENAGVDATTLLYDEALSLAKQGLLGAARDRLRMLLCLDPEDGDAHLLLAKVFIAQQNWCEARDQLAATLQVPPYLQNQVNIGLAAEGKKSEINAAPVPQDFFEQKMIPEPPTKKGFSFRFVFGSSLFFLAVGLMVGIVSTHKNYNEVFKAGYKRAIEDGESAEKDVVTTDVAPAEPAKKWICDTVPESQVQFYGKAEDGYTLNCASTWKCNKVAAGANLTEADCQQTNNAK